MRISTLARRSVATLAATALLTTGGAALGLTSGVANAQTVTGITRVGGAQAIGVNNGTSAFQANGTDFMPSSQQTVTLVPNPLIEGQGNISAVVRDNSAQCQKTFGVVAPDAPCTGPLVFDVNLSKAAPGTYDVFVAQSTRGKLNNTTETDRCVSCVLVVSAGQATVSSVAPSGTSNGPLTIKGTNFANGARVVFYDTNAQGQATTPNPWLDCPKPNIPDSTTLHCVYTAQPGAVGNMIIRVFNADDQSAPGPGALFVQPQVTSINPSVLGQGATAAIVSVNGGGFTSASTVAWSDPKVTAAGPITLTGAGFNVPTSVAADTAPGPKSLTVKGPSGGYTTVNNVLTVTAAPRPTSVTPNTRGQGSAGDLTINGSGFTPQTLFSFGQGIIATTLATTTPTAGRVNVQVSSDAAIGARTLTATNPDQGAGALANALNVVAKPIITKITPASAQRSQAAAVGIAGSGFETGGVTITVSGTGISVSNVVVSNPSQINATFTVAPDAAFGPRDVTIVNNGSQGQSTCVGCFGVNSLSVSPSGAVNNGSKVLVLSGPGLNGTSTVQMSLPGSQDYQSPITGTQQACDAPAADQICATFNLNNVATGAYTVTAVTGSSTLTCTACFTVQSAAPPAPTSASPNTGGQGAVDRSIVIAGTNFSPGEEVIFTGSGITVTKVNYNSPTQITAVLSIAENAPTGARGFTVRNIGDGASGSTGANAFTVTAGPKVTATDTNGLGQNAVADVTLTGTDFASGATVSFGPGITAQVKNVSATSLVATLTVADNADTTQARDIRVTNPDGGSGVLSNQFKVNPAPRITSIAPGFGKPGETKSVVISGSGFATQPATPSTNTSPTACPTGDNPAVQCPTVIVAGLLATVKSVSVDGTSMTADFAINAQSPISNPAARVINPDRGQSVKLAAFRIATVPVAPTNVAVTTNDTSATVTWAFPTTANADGGSPLTGFIVDDSDAATNNTQTVAPDVRTATFTGLTPGKVYVFTVKAGNAVGVGPAGTAATSQFVTNLTTKFSKPIAMAGDYIHYTGKLTRTANGAGAPNATIVVTLDPDFGPTRVFTTHTNSIGVWGFRFPTYYNMTVTARFSGNATDKADTAAPARLGTFVKIVKKSPGHNSSVTAGRAFAVTGYVNPAKTGRTVYLVRGNGALVAKAIVRSDRTFAFSAKLPRGYIHLRITMAAGGGNLLSASPYFAVNSL